MGAGTTAGGTAALGLAGRFGQIAETLAIASGELDVVAKIRADTARLQNDITATVLATELALAGSMCGRAKAPKKRPGTCPVSKRSNSFTGDTLVVTRNGLKEIQDIAVGDEVKAVNPITGTVAFQTVTERHARTTQASLVKVTLKDEVGKRETLTVTFNHPYLRAANDNS